MSELNELVQNLSNESIIKIVSELGSTDYKETKDAIIFRTICHNCDAEKASMKLYYYKDSKQFHCFTECGCNFNIIELFKKRYDLLNIQYDFYKDIVLKIGGGYSPREQQFYIPYKSFYDNLPAQPQEFHYKKIEGNPLGAFVFYPTVEWISEGISKETMKQYNILYSPIENKIILPHYDKDGKLIGIRGRTLNKEDEEYGKYMPIIVEGKMYSHPLGYNLYGLNLVKENIKRKKIAIVAESEKSCMQYNTMFGSDENICVACCGNNFNIIQLNLLLDLGVERVMIAFDKQGDSWAQKEKFFNKMQKLCNKYKMLCQMGFVFDTKNLLKDKQSPFDCGKEVTKILLKKGVWVQCNI